MGASPRGPIFRSPGFGCANRNFAFALILSVAVGSVAEAAVLRITSTVSTTVQELIDGSPGSINADRKELGIDAAEPPIAAAASLTSTDLEGNLVSMGQGFSQFEDPTRLEQPNPEELSLEVACYANVESVSYRVDGAVSETRTIIFTRPGSDVAPSEIAFRSDGTREIESRLFIEGAVVVWSTLAVSEVADLRGEIRVAVKRGGVADALWDSRLVVGVDDELELIASVTGPLVVENVPLAELAGLGMDEDTLAVLTDVAAQGLLQVLVIPRQEHTYRYIVTADVPLDLEAALSTQIRNTPKGTGIAVVLGRPFERLAEVIAQGLPGADGAAVERSINAATLKRDRTLAGNKDENPSPRFPPCGAMGMEMFGLIALGLTTFRKRFE